MNPTKEGRDYGFGNFGINDSSKSDGWHGDLEAILAEYETPSQSLGQSSVQSKNACEKSR